MKSSHTVPGVFIIESLNFDDEEKKRFEGRIISNILSLNNVQSKYYYIRTKIELVKVLKIFKDSHFRYLHISCHGGTGAIHTSLHPISYADLGGYLRACLKDKRLFLSACSSVNKELAEAVIIPSQCYSVIGPTHDVEFRDAAILWAAFYHLMFKGNESVMLRDAIVENLQKIVNTFGQEITYYSRSRSKGTTKTCFQVQETKTSTTESAMLE